MFDSCAISNSQASSAKYPNHQPTCSVVIPERVGVLTKHLKIFAPETALVSEDILFCELQTFVAALLNEIMMSLKKCMLCAAGMPACRNF